MQDIFLRRVQESRFHFKQYQWLLHGKRLHSSVLFFFLKLFNRTWAYETGQQLEIEHNMDFFPMPDAPSVLHTRSLHS